MNDNKDENVMTGQNSNILDVPTTPVKSKENKNNKSNNMILIIILIVVLLVGAGLSYYFLIVKQEKNINNDNNTISTTVEVTNSNIRPEIDPDDVDYDIDENGKLGYEQYDDYKLFYVIGTCITKLYLTNNNELYGYVQPGEYCYKNGKTDRETKIINGNEVVYLDKDVKDIYNGYSGSAPDEEIVYTKKDGTAYYIVHPSYVEYYKDLKPLESMQIVGKDDKGIKAVYGNNGDNGHVIIVNEDNQIISLFNNKLFYDLKHQIYKTKVGKDVYELQFKVVKAIHNNPDYPDYVEYENYFDIYKNGKILKKDFRYIDENFDYNDYDYSYAIYIADDRNVITSSKLDEYIINNKH